MNKGQYKFTKAEPRVAKQKVLFRFDNDEPREITRIENGQEFSMSIKDNGSIKFEKNGKTLTIYLQDI